MSDRMSDEDLTTIIERALRKHLKPEIERLTAERDAAMADCDHWRKDYTELQRLHLATDELLRARTMERDAALAREAEAFRAGAEAMRRKAAWLLEPQNDKSDWTPYAHDCHRLAEAIRALPIGAPT